MLSIYSVQVLVLVLFQMNVCHCETEIIATTISGAVRGSTLKTRQDTDIFVFHGIPYAESPTGENRFKPAKPIKPWKGVYDATKQNIACHQSNPDPSYIISEDCLLLDVYTKDLSASKPVIVFIHGGGFLFGAKSDISPTYLLEKDVVLVSINYRLHALGFFSTGTADAPGNNGFKDQVMALKWVQNNIRAFGGNPQLVTLNGHSAGGMSVSLHLVSPMSRGLFHRAILMSGTMMSHRVSETRDYSRKLLERTNCFDKNVTNALECLRNLPVEQIWNQDLITNQCPSIIWSYDIEPDSYTGERFLVEDPTTALLEGNIAKVPIMAGITDEFSYSAHLIKKNTELFRKFNKDFSTYAPLCFGYEHAEKKNKISEGLRKFYFNDKFVTDENMNKLEDLFADAIIGFGVYRFVSLASLHTQVFFYRFNFVGRYSHFYKPDGKPLGAVHGDELQYVYVFKKIAPVISENDLENVIIESMLEWWRSFAETGNPNNPNDENIMDIEWLPTKRNNYSALYINVMSKMGKVPNNDRYSYWDSIFPISDGGQGSMFSRNMEPKS